MFLTAKLNLTSGMVIGAASIMLMKRFAKNEKTEGHFGICGNIKPAAVTLK